MYIKKENYIQHNVYELQTSLKGAALELEACAWLIKQGYEVFRNVSPVGKADIIIWKQGEVPTLIDVKMGNGYSKIKNVLTLTKINEEFKFVQKTKSYRKKTVV
jgi:Holliday junction resolvase-like predicted endonuclease